MQSSSTRPTIAPTVIDAAGPQALRTGSCSSIRLAALDPADDFTADEDFADPEVDLDADEDFEDPEVDLDADEDFEDPEVDLDARDLDDMDPSQSSATI